MNNWKELNEIVRKKGLNKVKKPCDKKKMLIDIFIEINDRVKKLGTNPICRITNNYINIDKFNENIDLERIEKLENFVELYDLITDEDIQEFYIVKEDNAIKYLSLNDPTLKKSLHLAFNHYGLINEIDKEATKEAINNLSATILANMLISQEADIILFEYIQDFEKILAIKS
jgi:hypothetical protein